MSRSRPNARNAPIQQQCNNHKARISIKRSSVLASDTLKMYHVGLFHGAKFIWEYLAVIHLCII